MSSEVKLIFLAIENCSSAPSSDLFLAERRRERWWFLSAIGTFTCCILLLCFESTRAYSLLAGLIFLLIMIGYTIDQTFSIVKTFKHPLAGFADAALQRLEFRNVHVSALARFSSEGLHTVKIALDSDVSRMQKRIGMLIGAVEKVGFIPAGLTLCYAALQTSPSIQFAANILTAFVFGLYIGAFWVHRFIDTLCFNVSCIEEAYDLSLSREQFQKTR